MAQNKTEPGKGRGRPRAYDPQAALEQALGVFWSTGYSGASLDSIASAAGMNRPSLYAAFGDKQALYIKALEFYWGIASAAVERALDDNQLTLRQALTQFYQGQLAIYFSAEERARGCFVIGTATTEAMENNEIQQFLAQLLHKLDAHLERRIRQAITVGELKANADASALASLAASVLHSIAIRARAGVARESLSQMAESTVQLICD